MVSRRNRAFHYFHAPPSSIFSNALRRSLQIAGNESIIHQIFQNSKSQPRASHVSLSSWAFRVFSLIQTFPNQVDIQCNSLC